MKIKVYPYKQGSRSASSLAKALGGKVLKTEGSKYVPKAGDLVINWGSSSFSYFNPAQTLNSLVATAQCKLKAFQAMAEGGVRVPDFVDTKEDASKLSYPVVCRTVLNGHSGAGIVIANNANELVEAPLYTAYVKKRDEYRVHVLRGNPFFVQRKARKVGHDTPNWQVRNLSGGFVFVEATQVPKDVLDQAEAAIVALGLDFGGVDVLWNDHEQKAYVLEVNTACGLEERTADKYAEAIKQLFT